MQNLAHNIFEEINKLREDPSAYKEIIGEYSDIALSEIEKFDQENEKYVWNEGLARAARHYLNEKGSCGTNGDAYGFGYRSLLSSLYVFSYEQLEYELVTSPYLVNPDDFEDSYTDSILFILSQTHLSKNLIRHQESRQIGIGCACAGDSFEGEHVYSCIIAVAESAPA